MFLSCVYDFHWLHNYQQLCAEEILHREPLRYVAFDWNALLLWFYLILCLFMAWRLPSPARASGNFTVWQPRAFISQRTRALRPPLWRVFSWNYFLIRSARSNNIIILQHVTITFNDNISGHYESDSTKVLCFVIIIYLYPQVHQHQTYFSCIFKRFYFKTI